MKTILIICPILVALNFGVSLVVERLHEPEIFVTSESLSSPDPRDWIIVGGQTSKGEYLSDQEATTLVFEKKSFHPTSVSEDWIPPFPSK